MAEPGPAAGEDAYRGQGLNLNTGTPTLIGDLQANTLPSLGFSDPHFAKSWCFREAGPGWLAPFFASQAVRQTKDVWGDRLALEEGYRRNVPSGAWLTWEGQEATRVCPPVDIQAQSQGNSGPVGLLQSSRGSPAAPWVF